MATGIKRQHEPPRIVGDLLSADIAEKKALSIKYQLTVAKLPIAKDIDGFDFEGTLVNEVPVRDLASGNFVADQRNALLVGGTGTGKSHPLDQQARIPPVKAALWAEGERPKSWASRRRPFVQRWLGREDRPVWIGTVIDI